MPDSPSLNLRRVVNSALLACLLAGGALAFVPAKTWRLFRSASGFSVRYPAWWVRFSESSTAQLSLRSSHGGAEGVILKPGQAYLWVADAPRLPKETAASLAEYYRRDADSASSLHELPVDAVQGDCRTLTETMTWEPVTPREGVRGRPPEMVNAILFCDLGNRTVVTLVRNYMDDAHTDEYQQIARQVAGSVRLGPR